MAPSNHFLIVAFPAQGHINPALQFAKSLIRTGAQVTFSTTVSAHQRMLNTTTPNGLTFAPFSDGRENPSSNNPSHDRQHFRSEIKRHGTKHLTDLILAFANKGHPVTCLIYTLLLPWTTDVARNLNIQSALLWIQPAFVFNIYYYYFNGYKNLIANKSNENDPSISLKLPGLPLLMSQDIPSFLLPSNNDPIIKLFQEQFQVLNQETKPLVLVNTFDALESEAIKAVDGINLIGIGPLVPSAFLDGKDPLDTSFGADIFHSSANCIEWLNSKEKSSVVYVSFGTFTKLKTRQMEEITNGLIESGRPFLWVSRQQHNGSKEEGEDTLMVKQGIIVPWCSQVEVLGHASVGCFVTHCGWNSTLEGLVGGVPLVAFPQFSEQGTNAKLIEDVWKIGVRVKVKVKEGEKIVESEELRRCLEEVMGERGEEIRSNSKKWKDLAREAVEEGGSSEKNLQEITCFLQKSISEINLVSF